LLRSGEPAVAAFAPARVDVLGGITDYSWATSWNFPLANGVEAIAQHATDQVISAATPGPMALTERLVALRLTLLLEGDPHAASIAV
jgi:hypothetical protein